uniref:Caspase-8 n=1 Tax=Haemaphysalis longicornis TaxID=44386 RepID=Q0Z8U7_HAELO|nr:caspase-8 [Haemaphysalis longicornis]
MAEKESLPQESMEDPGSWKWPGSWTPTDGGNAKLPLLPAKELQHGEHVYPMTQKPRGLCIIINNVDFGNRFPKRHGSEVDVRRMEDLFEALFFRVQTHRDLSADDMKSVLSDAAKEDKQKNAECLVVILMSHGENDGIYGTDGKWLNLKQEVYTQFNDSNCPSLQGKPKLFFVQACRGREDDFRTDGMRGAPNSSHKRKDWPTLEQDRQSMDWIADVSEMHIAEATRPELVAHRDTAFGSWFLSAVYKIFTCHAWELPLERLMERVQEEVQENTSDSNIKQFPLFTKLRATKELYFNPGLRKTPPL